MFVTHQEHKSPLSISTDEVDEQLWSRVALVFQKQWVMLSIRHTEVNSDGDRESGFKTLFLSNFASIAFNIFAGKKGDTVELVSGYIFTPVNEKATEKFDWSMEAVAKVWLAESDDDPGATLEVCETKSGVRHIVTRFVNQDIKLKNLKLILDFT
jgi:hypothetical protein